MTLGDSITQGIHINSKNIGYRRDLYNLLKSNGYQIDLVGSMHDGSVSDFDKDHEGHGGYRADQIRDNLAAKGILLDDSSDRTTWKKS